MNASAPHLVFGDDGSAAADVVWLWINNHHWPQWRISVVTAAKPPLGAPVGPERSTPHPWEPLAPRTLLTAGDDVQLEHLVELQGKGIEGWHAAIEQYYQRLAGCLIQKL